MVTMFPESLSRVWYLLLAMRSCLGSAHLGPEEEHSREEGPRGEVDVRVEWEGVVVRWMYRWGGEGGSEVDV